MKICRLFILLSLSFLIFQFTLFSVIQGEELHKPSWWERVDFEVERKERVLEQYFYIRDRMQATAFYAQGKKRELIFKKAIIAYTKLIEWFDGPMDMTTSCMAQYQIAWCYRQIGDVSREKESYKRCLQYEQYVKDPPVDKGDLGILAITASCRGKLRELQ